MTVLPWVLLWPNMLQPRCGRLWWAMGRHHMRLFLVVLIHVCPSTPFLMQCQVICLCWGMQATLALMLKAAWLEAWNSAVANWDPSWFCGKLGSKLILVLGHTQCGAIAGATKTYLTSKGGNSTKNAGCALEGLLIGLSRVAEQAEEELGVGARLDHLVAHSVKVNVFHSIDFLLKFSEPLRKLVKSGTLLIKLHFTFYFLFVAFVLFFDIMEDIEVWHFSPVKPLCRKPGNPGWHLPHGNGSCGVSRVFSEAGGVVGFWLQPSTLAAGLADSHYCAWGDATSGCLEAVERR